jgi:3-oxoacyl-[acyl-carrier protein] reductase
MDLGIRGRRALICASSKGLGKGCAEALAGEGVDLILNARGAESLEATAASIRSTYGVSVEAVAADITTEAGQAAVLETAGLWSDWGRDDFIAAFDANLLTPIALIKAALPGMMDRGWGRIVNITSVAVKAPIPVLGLSNTARSGLTGYVAGVSRQVAGSGVTINNLLPGLHDTDRLVTLDKLDAGARGISEDDARQARMQSVPAGRFGTSEEFGGACAWLCSDKAGFVIGQNILLDGGAFPGAL